MQLKRKDEVAMAALSLRVGRRSTFAYSAEIQVCLHNVRHPYLNFSEVRRGGKQSKSSQGTPLNEALKH